MTTDVGLQKVKEVLKTGSEPHLMTGDQYKESLRDGRRVIDSKGQPVEDVTSHPQLARAVDNIAALFDMQFEPDTRDAFTYLDPADGERYAIGWQIPTEKEHLRRKLEALRLSTLKTFGIFGRPPDYGSMMALGFLAVNDKIERENPEFAQNVRDFIKLSRAHNLMSTDLIPDVQADRRIPASEKPGRLRAVEERPDGIVLYGAKPCGSIGSISHFFTLSTALSPGLDEAACLWGVLPANIEGLTLVLREPVTDPNAEWEDHPLDSRGEEIDNLLLFDNVFLPREYLVSFKNKELLGLYHESGVVGFWHILARLAVRAEIFVGVAQTIVDVLGTGRIPSVRDSVSEIIKYAAILKAGIIAAVEQAEVWNGVTVPNLEYVTPVRLYSIEQYPRIMHLLRDLCGQGMVSRWPKALWEHPEIGKKLDEFMPGTGVTAREKNRVFNLVWDLACSSHAARVAMFENTNATPRAFVSEELYQHYDREAACRLIRGYLDINPERVVI
ncbi:MAG: 4-hydroxyphenylacetate 3-hydroxylase N-terminal domain-containing protein [Alphaproteobacteria bacterium]